MKLILGKIILENQKGFFGGMNLMDEVITTHETLHSMNADVKPAITLKLDISKAYDRVKSAFLVKVLTIFGFYGKFHKMIMSCVTSTSFVVLVDSAPLVFFTTGSSNTYENL